MDTDRPHPWQSTWKPRYQRKKSMSVQFPFELGADYDDKFRRYTVRISDAEYGDGIWRDLLNNVDKHDFPKASCRYFWNKYIFANHKSNLIGFWYCANLGDVNVKYNPIFLFLKNTIIIIYYTEIYYSI